MARKSVCCIASAETQAAEVLQTLKQIGVSSRDISTLVADKTGPRDFGYECRNKSSEGAFLGGLLLGGAAAGLGWLAGLGVLPLGPAAWAAAGPGVCSLSAASLGVVVGGIIGGALGLARPEYVVRRFQGKLAEGNILLSVHCEDSCVRDQVISVFEDAGAHDIGVCQEVDTGAPSAVASSLST